MGSLKHALYGFFSIFHFEPRYKQNVNCNHTVFFGLFYDFDRLTEEQAYWK